MKLEGLKKYIAKTVREEVQKEINKIFIKEGKSIKMTESTLKRVVERVVKEQSKQLAPLAKKLTKAQIDAITAIFKKKETSLLDKIWKAIKDISYETEDGKKVIGTFDRDAIMKLLRKIL